MRRERKTAALTIPLFLLAACGQSEKASNSVETKQTYSLCPKANDAAQKLYEKARSFADQQEARFIDRGAGAQRELSGMGSGVLKNTGGEVILLTIEKADEFRISVTNLGLKEKIALSVRSWGDAGENSPVTNFMDDLERFWTVERVSGSVTNDPPC